MNETDRSELVQATEAAWIEPNRMILRSSMAVTNIHTGVEVRSVAPGGAFGLVGEAKRLFDRVAEMPAGVPNVDGWLIEGVFERQAQLVVAVDKDEIVGMACYHPDAASDIVIRSLVVDPAAKGMGLSTAMIGLTVRHAPTVYPGAGRFVCSIRQMPNGDLNEPSRRSFEKLGFVLEPNVGMSYLDGSFSNRNKWPTAELDEVGAVYIRYRLMFSSAETSAAAATYLQEWSNAVLPIPERLRIR